MAGTRKRPSQTNGWKIPEQDRGEGGMTAKGHGAQITKIEVLISAVEINIL